MKKSVLSLGLAILMASTSAAVLADDWVADRLRGDVKIFERGAWTVLERGDIVSDGDKIRTSGTGRAELVRGQERIALAANTEITIRDEAGQAMTSLIQSRGTVTVDVEKRNVQHFSVQTPVLAAVVKGTQFTVSYVNGQARVDVERGVVQVQDPDDEMVVDVTRGQSAEARQTSPVNVTGPGADRVTYLIQGAPVPAVARQAVLSGLLAPGEAVAAARNHTVPGVAGNGRAEAPGAATSAQARAGTGLTIGAATGGGRDGSVGVNAGVGSPGSVGVNVGAGSAGAGAGNSAAGSGGGVSVSVGTGGAGGENSGGAGAGVSVGTGGSGNSENGDRGGLSVEVGAGGLNLGLGL